jgi:hypothetical protein
MIDRPEFSTMDLSMSLEKYSGDRSPLPLGHRDFRGQTLRDEPLIPDRDLSSLYDISVASYNGLNVTCVGYQYP